MAKATGAEPQPATREVSVEHDRREGGGSQATTTRSRHQDLGCAFLQALDTPPLSPSCRINPSLPPSSQPLESV